MSLAAMRVVERDDTVTPGVDIAGIGERASRLGIEIADIVGIIEDLGNLGQQQLDALRSVVHSAKATGAANAQLAASMEEAREGAAQTRALLSTSADTVASTLADAVSNMRTLSEGVIGFATSLAKVSETIKLVREACASI